MKGQLAEVGGPAYLGQLDQLVPFSHNAVDYAEIIKNQSTRRSLARAGREIMELASQDSGETEVMLEEAEGKVFRIAERKREGELKPMGDLMDEALTLLDKMKQNASGITGVSTGFVDLDTQLTGLHGGELIVLAARPGIGKTSLAMNIALHVAAVEKRAVARVLAGNALGAAGHPPARHPGAHRHEEAARRAPEPRRTKAASSRRPTTCSASKFFVDDSGGLSSFDLRAKARRLKMREPDMGLIVIDYLQLMHQKGKVESRQLEVSEISRALKQLSKELDVPIIALSQLNRKVEERSTGKPMLSDLRESGAIEQDADVVMFIHRENDAEEGAPQETSGAMPVELIVAKQRNGPVGSVDLVFLAEYTKFESRAREWQA